MPINSQDQSFYKVPAGYDYFATGGPNGGFANNLQSAPEGTVFDLGASTQGTGLYDQGQPTQYFKKMGNELVPVYDQSLYGEAKKVYAPAGSGVYRELGKSMGFRPYEMGIGVNGQTAAQSQAAYEKALGTSGTTQPPSGSVTSPSGQGQQPNQTGATQQSNPIMQAYARRPDLQALYNPDGSAKNPNDPRVRGIPTLQDWAKNYGQNEDPAIKTYLASNPSGTPGGTQTGGSGQSGSNQGTGPYVPPGWTIGPDGHYVQTPGAPGSGGSQGDGAGASSGDINAKLKSFGFTDEQIAAMPDNIKATMAGLIDQTNKNFDSGNTSYTIDQAMEAAAKDPTILQKYGDMARIGLQQLQTSMGLLQGQTTEDMQNLATQFQNQQGQASALAAEAGLGQSGIRQKAAQQLKQQQEGIVSSNRRTLQGMLSQQGLAFESMFGSGATNPAAGGISYIDPLTGLPVTLGYSALGGITGSNVTGQQQEVAAKAADIYNLQHGGRPSTSVL